MTKELTDRLLEKERDNDCVARHALDDKREVVVRKPFVAADLRHFASICKEDTRFVSA